MKLLIVNYHYFGSEDQHERGIYPTSPERFERQLDELGASFTYISQTELLAAVEGGKNIPERSCLITFDDGLRSQYEIALPTLDRKGIPGIFFSGALPQTEHRAMAVHKVHWLFAHNDFEALSDGLWGVAVEHGIDGGLRNDLKFRKEAQDKYCYDNEETAVLKVLLNSTLDAARRDLVVGMFFAKQVQDEAEFAEELYFSQEQMIDLARRNMLGLHGHDHTPLVGPAAEVVANVAANKAAIESIVATPIQSISYPYGSIADLDIEALPGLRALGIRLGFTMEPSINSTLKEPLLFARIDTNDAPGGKRPTFSMEDESILATGNLSMRRHLFTVE